jgi:hypothetical protein
LRQLTRKGTRKTDPFCCSPLGKLWGVSQPYAPGGTPVWTTYTYDGIGRTLSAAAPAGNLIAVLEPNPDPLSNGRFATIAGRTAYTRLAALAADPRFSSLNISELIAVSLRLTSYVVSSEQLGYSGTCGTFFQPRNALNLFILAREKRDRPWLEASLGPGGRAALADLVKRGSQSTLLAPTGSEGAIRDVAIGYRFMISDPWAEPSLRLRENNQISGNVVPSQLNPEIETAFTNRSGEVCGSHRVKFTYTLQAGIAAGPLAYVIDNSDLEALFRTLEGCTK